MSSALSLLLTPLDLPGPAPPRGTQPGGGQLGSLGTSLALLGRGAISATPHERLSVKVQRPGGRLSPKAPSFSSSLMDCFALSRLLGGGDPVGDLGALDFCEGRGADEVGEEDLTCSAFASFFACDTLEGEDFGSSFFTSLGLSGDFFLDLVLLRLLLFELFLLFELSDLSRLFA